MPNHPFGLGVFENQLYYTDWYKNGKGIKKLNKFSGSNQKIKDTLWSHMDIKVFHPLRQPNGNNVNTIGCIIFIRGSRKLPMKLNGCTDQKILIQKEKGLAHIHLNYRRK